MNLKKKIIFFLNFELRLHDPSATPCVLDKMIENLICLPTYPKNAMKYIFECMMIIHYFFSNLNLAVNLFFRILTMELEDNQLVLRDFLPGPLDDYRKQAKFNWRKLKFFFEDPDLLKLKVRITNSFL